MTNVVESNQAEVEHHDAIVEAHFVGAAGRNIFDQAHHVVSEIADRAADQRGQAGHADGTVAGREPAEKLDGIFGGTADAAAGLDGAIGATSAEDFFGIRSGEGVAGDVLAAFDAFEEKRIFCAVGDAQMRADGREQVGGEGVVDRDEIALAGEAREGFEIGLNHRVGRLDFRRDAIGGDFCSNFPAAARARTTAWRMGASGARWPIQISHWAVP